MYEKCKVVLTVILPHLINDKNKYKVLYSPFHRWEHLFIKILKSNLQKYSEIYGQCSAKETILTIIYEYDNKYEYESKNIKNILRYGHISRKKVDKEKYIINNEISFLE